MFGIGLGEILLILFVVFLISPKDIPKVMQKIGQFFASMERLRKEFTDAEGEFRDAANEIRNVKKDVEDQIKKEPRSSKPKKTPAKGTKRK